MKMDYKSSGVDVKAGEAAVKSIKEVVRTTYNKNVLSELGSFGGLYRFETQNWMQPVLVSSTDGVGTKLRVAIMAGVFDTVGQDLVNHCVNDILVQGAIPQFFLDYIGVGKLNPDHIKQIIGGLVKACKENACALIGGEMAEMPGIYQEGDFDLVGTIIGCVDKENLLPRSSISDGDVLVGLKSSGLHTNGYSLARKIIFEKLGLGVESYVEDCSATITELLLSVHKSYLPILQPYLLNPALHGLAHITGGGIAGNLKRIIPEGYQAVIESKNWEVPPLFKWLECVGELDVETMHEAFNMGIGMIAIMDEPLANDFVRNHDSIILGNLNKTDDKVNRVLIV